MAGRTKLAKLADYKAPWEIDAQGNDIDEAEQKIDPAKLKPYIHGLLTDKDRLQASVETKDARITELETEVASAPKTGDDEVDKLREKVATLTAENKAATEKVETLKTQFTVAAERGLTMSQATRLQGKDVDEMREDAEEMFGPAPEPEGNQPDGGDVSRRTRRTATATKVGGGGKGDDDDWDMSVDDMLKAVPRSDF